MKIKAALRTIGLIAAAIPQFALAQTTPPSEVASAPSPQVTPENSGLADIIVTARRTEENLQNVPVAITAFSQDALQKRAVRDIFDLQEATPSLSVASTQSGGRSVAGYTIRGQQQAADDAPPGVVAYLNDVPVFNGEVSRSLFDLSVVQVLKGPQGTLFGKNTNGGAILFNTRRPDFDFNGYVTGRYGNLDDKYVEGAINIPLGQTFAIRAAGNLERRDGFTKNLTGPDVDNLRYGNGRVSLRFEPNSDFSNDTVFNYTNINERGPGYILSEFLTSPPVLGGGSFPAPYVALGAAQLARDPRTISNSSPGYTKLEAFGVSNTTVGVISDQLKIKNIMAYHDQKLSGLLDYDGLPVDILSVGYARHSKQMTEELQLQSSFLDDRASLIVGGFYSYAQEDPFSGSTRFGATNAGYVLTPLFFYNLQFEHQRNTSKALFTQGSFKFTNRLTLTAGFRYTWDTAKLFDTQQMFFVPGTIVVPPAFVPPAGFSTCAFGAAPANSPFTVNSASCLRSGNVDFSAANYSVTLDYKLATDSIIYLSHRHGYKTGGFNTTSSFLGQQNIFSPEKVDDVEAGLKLQTKVGEAQVRFNVSGFYSWYKQLQLTQVIVDPVSGPQSLTQNVGKAELYGAEAELTVVPIRGLTLGGSLTYFDGSFKQGIIIDSNAGLINLAGLKYRSQPRFSWLANAAYTTSIGGGSDLSASASYSGREGYYTTYSVTPGNFISGYGLVNARLGVTNVAGTGIGVSVFGKNIFDKAYSTTVVRGGAFGFNSRLYGEPRTYGVEATIKF